MSEAQTVPGTRSTLDDFSSYMLDLWQRNILFLDVLRQRGNQYHEQVARAAPSVLDFDTETVVDGAALPRPVNYRLKRVLPPEGVTTDPVKRPFMIVDPRAGHGPGIGGFKADSEIGVALRAGHACYFASFLPMPVKGQTVLDVVRAEIHFLEHIIAAHPEAEGKPVVIGNCQAGWQIMMGAALKPELFGPIIIAGAPLSYWAGTKGGPPMRYSGGMLGGSWMTALAGDLGHGLFDGSWLVQNFENLDPTNTWWSKQYNVLSRIDTEPARYLGFEKWWNRHVLLNADEMQYIVDNLFIGNKLATAELNTETGERIDLRNIRSPIVVFCSKGDNITPPPQALGWITDLYSDVNDIRARGQTIVYAVHDSIGHLGIFVSGKVAKKEHEEFASNIDFIDILPPGLYEAEITERADGAGGNPYLMRFAGRTLDDIRAIVQPDPEDERRFGTVRRLSENNLAVYRTLMQPFVRAMVTEPVAETLRRLHPLRMSYDFFSNRNPFMFPVAQLAEMVRAHRKPVAPDNAFRQWEADASSQIERSLDAYRDVRDGAIERMFRRIYGLPTLQGLLGLQQGQTPRHHPGVSRDHQELLRIQIGKLREDMAKGGAREATLRAILYVALAERMADERSFEALRRLLDEEGDDMSLVAFKCDLRTQFLMLLIDRREALATLPKLLAGLTPAEIAARLAEVRRVVTAGGALGPMATARLAEIEALFVPAEPPPPTKRVRKAAPRTPALPRSPAANGTRRRSVH